MRLNRGVFVFTMLVIVIMFLSISLRGTPDLEEKGGNPDTDLMKSMNSQDSILEDKTIAPGEKSCAICHESITREYHQTSHGKAGVDCSSCHTFTEKTLAHPDEYLQEGFYENVTTKTCERCHSSQVDDWKRGRHIDPLTILYKNLFDDNWKEEPPSSFSSKQDNPCLSCHQPHPVER